MKVTTISASVRFSKAIQPGCYKTVELSAEGTLMPKEDWHEAQAILYADLGEQLKQLWTTRNGTTDTAEKRDSEPTQDDTPEHYCGEHRVEYRRYEKGDSIWYAHKHGDLWCREK